MPRRVISLGLASLTLSCCAILSHSPKQLLLHREAAALSIDIDRVDLGRRLFFDKRVSGDEVMACASCHRPELGFGDGRAKAIGRNGKVLQRHSPSLYNLAFNHVFFWDGRATSLEDQIREVLENPDEMSTTLKDLTARLSGIETYARDFRRNYPKAGLTSKTVVDAIATFVRSIISFDSPLDRYLEGESTALSDGARRGLDLFVGRAGCVKCHSGANMTDNDFHHTGVPTDDLGRIKIDRNPKFRMRPYPFFGNHKAFKTPGLRNVALSPPYFHNGSMKSLHAVVEFYNNGGAGTDAQGRSPDIQPLGLAERDLNDLVAFLQALTSPVEVSAPPTR